MASLQSVAEPVVEQVVAEEKEEKEEADIDMDDLESSDDEDALMVFAKVAKAGREEAGSSEAGREEGREEEGSSEAGQRGDSSGDGSYCQDSSKPRILTISQGCGFQATTEGGREERQTSRNLSSFPEVGRSYCIAGRVTTQRGQPGKGKKATRRRAHRC